MITLRDYQQRGVDDIRASYRAGKRAPCYVLPTGGGKSIVLAHIGKGVAARDKRVTVIVHREELVEQLSTAFDKVDCPHGLIHPDYTENLAEAVQVASVDTLANRIKRHPARYRPDLWIQDEAHHLLRANKWGRVIAMMDGALGLGVTATAGRLSGEGLGVHAGGFFDDLILGPSVRELITAGALVQPVVYCPPKVADLDDVRVVRGEFDRAELGRRLDKPTVTGDVVEHYLRICRGARTLVFAQHREHSRHLAAEYRAHGIRAAHVDSETPAAERKRAVREFRDGELTVMTNVDLFGEGFDVPGVEAVQMVRRTMSLTMYLQMCGRALRPADGKTRGVIIDHVGNAGAIVGGMFQPVHGMPDDDREWSLDSRPRRTGADGGAFPPVPMQQCPTCYAAHHPAEKCPACGHVYGPTVTAPRFVDAELVEVTPEQAEATRRERRREVGRAQSLEALREVATRLGYKPGWADHVWNARQKKRANA